VSKYVNHFDPVMPAQQAVWNRGLSSSAIPPFSVIPAKAGMTDAVGGDGRRGSLSAFLFSSETPK
jgi:hypothetical protein